MGMALTLLPYRNPGPWVEHLAYDRLALHQDYMLFAQIDQGVMGKGRGVRQVCRPQRLPIKMRLMWYGDGGIEDASEDPYGAPLTYVAAGELATVDCGYTDPWNRAVFEMMKALPKDTPVVLWWH